MWITETGDGDHDDSNDMVVMVMVMVMVVKMMMMMMMMMMVIMMMMMMKITVVLAILHVVEGNVRFCLIQEWSLLMTDSGPQAASSVSTLDTREHSSTTLGGASQQGRASLRHHFATSRPSVAEQSIALTSNTNQLPVLGRAPGGPGWGIRTLPITLGVSEPYYSTCLIALSQLLPNQTTIISRPLSLLPSHPQSCVSAVDLHPFRPIAACGTDTGSVSVHRIDLSETL